jgi:hypothetical protein
MKLTTHLNLVPSSKMRGAIHPLPHMYPWRDAYQAEEKLYLFIMIRQFVSQVVSLHGNVQLKSCIVTRVPMDATCPPNFTVLI